MRKAENFKSKYGRKMPVSNSSRSPSGTATNVLLWFGAHHFASPEYDLASPAVLIQRNGRSAQPPARAEKRLG